MSFLAEVFEWDYQFFIGELTDPTRDYTEYQTSLLALVTAITDPKTSLKAITSSIERVDGKQPDDLEVIFPKFYTTYPSATTTIDGVVHEKPPETTKEESKSPSIPSPEALGLRAEIQRLSEQKRGYVDQVLLAAQLIQDGKPSINQPKVKTVAGATLYLLSRRSMLALNTLLEQVEGKVKEKIRLLGDDVYIQNFAPVAPAGSYLNEDGILQREDPIVTNMWQGRLDAGR